MGCSTCGKNKVDAYQNRDLLNNPPMNSSDIMVFDGSTRRFNNNDWPDGNKLILCVESINKVEIENICDELDSSVQTIVLTNEAIQSVANKLVVAHAVDIWSSYLLCSRLGVMRNGKTRKSAALILKDGDLSVVETFYNNDFDMYYLYRQIKQATDKL